MKYLALIFICLLLAGCQTETAPSYCRNSCLGVKSALDEKYGAENVEIIRLENYNQKTWTYHKQVRVRTKSGYLWAECPSRTIYLLPYQNPNCKPYKRLKQEK